MIKIGQDVRIDDSAKITRPHLAIIGNHVAIDYSFYCTTQLSIGDYVHISSHCSVIGGTGGKLTIEDFVFISSGTRIVCGSDNMLGDGIVGPFIPDKYKDKQTIGEVTFKRFSGAAVNSIILPNVVLAEGSVLGANSLLKESTEPWTIYVGSPAKPIKKRKSEKIYQYAKEMGYDYARL